GTARIPGLVRLVEKPFAEVDAAQSVLVGDGNLVELLIGSSVLNVGFDKRCPLLNSSDQHLFLSNRLLNQCCLIGSERTCFFILGYFLGVRPRHSQSKNKEGLGDLSKLHVISYDEFLLSF